MDAHLQLPLHVRRLSERWLNDGDRSDFVRQSALAIWYQFGLKEERKRRTGATYIFMSSFSKFHSNLAHLSEQFLSEQKQRAARELSASRELRQ